MNAIEIKNLTKHYRDFTLDNLSLTLPEGCILGLIVENGAGKTTTMRLLLGMARPDGGTAEVLGSEGRAVREQLGVVMDEPGLPACLTSEQVGKLLGGLYKSWDAAEYDALLRRLEIGPPAPRDRERELAELTASVNAERLSNHPMTLSPAQIRVVYRRAFTPLGSNERQACLDIWKYYGT